MEEDRLLTLVLLLLAGFSHLSAGDVTRGADVFALEQLRDLLVVRVDHLERLSDDEVAGGLLALVLIVDLGEVLRDGDAELGLISDLRPL